MKDKTLLINLKLIGWKLKSCWQILNPTVERKKVAEKTLNQRLKQINYFKSQHGVLRKLCSIDWMQKFVEVFKPSCCKKKDVEKTLNHGGWMLKVAENLKPSGWFKKVAKKL